MWRNPRRCFITLWRLARSDHGVEYLTPSLLPLFAPLPAMRRRMMCVQRDLSSCSLQRRDHNSAKGAGDTLRERHRAKAKRCWGSEATAAARRKMTDWNVDGWGRWNTANNSTCRLKFPEYSKNRGLIYQCMQPVLISAPRQLYY